MAPVSYTIPALVAVLVWAATCLAGSYSVRRLALPAKGQLNSPDQYQFLPPLSSQSGPDTDELRLLDICLVASVDGKFHALSRSTGRKLWSMDQASSFNASLPALFPLVRTQHPEAEVGFLDDNDNHELFVIEPQTGDIYILPSPGGALQRFPFSMPQLVDLSPFRMNEEDGRVFVGKKETSLLILELETGRVKGTVNSECPWDPFGDYLISDRREKGGVGNDFLDELEADEVPPERTSSTDILIGRTDYYVTIHSPPTATHPRPTTQTLVYSAYGPNSQDLMLQKNYRHTEDDQYIESLPSGDVLSLLVRRNAKNDGWEKNRREKDQPPYRWGLNFKSPIVAIFDVLQSPSRQHPLVLLQPRPRLQDALPAYDALLSGQDNNPFTRDTTYVGAVEINGTASLFAMSPEHYPLVLFPSQDNDPVDLPTIDAPPGTDMHVDLPEDVDSVTRARKERAACSSMEGIQNVKCLVGMKQVEISSSSRYQRLLDAVPNTYYEDNNDSRMVPYPKPEPSDPLAPGQPRIPDVLAIGPAEDANSGGITLGTRKEMLSGAALGFALLLFAAWYIVKKQTRIAKSSIPPDPARFAASSDASMSAPMTHISSSAQHNHTVTSTSSTDSQQVPTTKELPPLPNGHVETTPPTPRLRPQTPKLPEGEPNDEDQDDEGEEEDEAGAQSGKKRPTRRRRRGKKNRDKDKMNGNGNAASGEDAGAEEPATPEIPKEMPKDANEMEKLVEVVQHIPPPETIKTPTSSLIVSEEVLGFGSHGTVVYKGFLQGRGVAVKRLLRDFVTVATREVDILQESDDHPNVIRYFYQEAQGNFFYIALELCPATLAEVIERPDLHQEISANFDRKRALTQITSGLRHLHALKIIHRDIKPQNILISAAKKGAGVQQGHRMLISDFGLCKKLEIDQTSFYPTAYGAMAAGTVGWRAPEILRGDVKLDDTGSEEASQSSRSSSGTVMSGSGAQQKLTRLTKSVDIFALGCLFYYILTSGDHPYGDRYEREVNIIKDFKNLGALESFGEEGLEAIDLITKMLDPDASRRPDTTTCLMHPFFWNPARRLTFLQEASDRFEIMCRDPREPDLLELEAGAYGVVGNDWQNRLDKIFLDNLGKFRKYDGKSVQDLLRALRNKKHHYQDLPDNVKRHLGPLPDGFLSYFTRRFPLLFMHVHAVISRTNLRYESMFKVYFELAE